MKIFSVRIQLTFSFIVLTTLFLTSCTTTQQSSNSRRLNLNYLYNPNSYALHAKEVAFNSNDTTTTIHCFLPSKEILFIPDGETKSCRLTIKYTLYQINNGLKIKDTASFIQHIKFNEKENVYHINFDVKAKDSSDYMLDLAFYDFTENKIYQNYITIERSKLVNTNDFLIVNKKGIPYTERYFCDSDTFAVVLRKKMSREWKIAWFTNSFKLCSPPYAMSSSKDFIMPQPDSIRVKLICDTCYFTVRSKSLMHFYRDSIGNGITLLNISNDYPQFSRPSELLQPLRMLNSQKEFNEISLLADKKEAVDRFWLGVAGNVNRARELIRVFYTRAMLANQYFTSFTEGWKTDRGIIYIIFGLPTTIYKAPNIEQWIYGTPQSSKVLVFNFSKKTNPFSNNHFVFERNEAYKISWLQAVDTWRNGRVFSIGE